MAPSLHIHVYTVSVHLCVQGARPHKGVISLVKHVIGRGEVVYK